MERLIKAQQIILSIVEKNGMKWPSKPITPPDIDFPFPLSINNEHIYAWATIEDEYTYFLYVCQSWDKRNTPHIMLQFDEKLFMVQILRDFKKLEFTALEVDQGGYKLFQEAIDRYAIERFALEQTTITLETK